MTPTRSKRPSPTPRPFADKTIGQVADHYSSVIGQLEQQAGHHRPLVRRPARRDPRRPRASRRCRWPSTPPRPAASPSYRCSRCARPRPCSAIRPTGTRGPADLRAVPLLVRQRRRRGPGQAPVRHVRRPGPRRPALAGCHGATSTAWTKVDTRNPNRGPMLIVSGKKDHTVPPTLIPTRPTRASRSNPGVTEFTEIPDRGHALTIDDGSRGQPYGPDLHPPVRVALSPAGPASVEAVPAGVPGRPATVLCQVCRGAGGGTSVSRCPGHRGTSATGTE